MHHALHITLTGYTCSALYNSHPSTPSSQLELSSSSHTPLHSSRHVSLQPPSSTYSWLLARQRFDSLR